MSGKERFDGPTKERMLQEGAEFDVGDDQQGTIVYRSRSRLEQTYNTWRARVGSRDERDLNLQYAALKELGRAFEEGGMLGNVGSVDCNRTYSPSAAGRTGLAKTERQLNDRDTVYLAQQKLSHHQWIVVSNVVFNDLSLIIAGYAIGAESQTSAHRIAGNKLRDAGTVVARLLGY